MSTINIAGLSKAKVLAALFNASRQQGLGFLDSRGAKPMTEEDAEAVIQEQGMYFDYLRGRVMKVSLSGDELRPGAYDRDNGIGAAERAIAAVRALASA